MLASAAAQGLGSIRSTSQLLNQETRRKELLRSAGILATRAQIFKKVREGEEGGEAKGWDFPGESILLHDVTYSFEAGGRFPSVLPPMACQIEAGQIVCLRGSGSVGKNLMLRLLGKRPKSKIVWKKQLLVLRKA